MGYSIGSPSTWWRNLFFALYSRLKPMLYFKHGIHILLGKYDSDDDPGQITHFEALSSALAGTVGMGNIAGVAVAINTGGPGAIFWMWITAVIGMSTNFSPVHYLLCSGV